MQCPPGVGDTYVCALEHQGIDVLMNETREIGRLSRETWFLRNPGSTSCSASDDLLAARGVVPSTLVVLGSQETLKHLARTGRGVGMAFRSGLEPELGAGLRCELRLYAVLDRHRRLTDVATAFLDTLDVQRTDSLADSAAQA